MRTMEPLNQILGLSKRQLDIFWTQVDGDRSACLPHNEGQSLARNTEGVSSLPRPPPIAQFFSQGDDRGSGHAEVLPPFIIHDNAIDKIVPPTAQGEPGWGVAYSSTEVCAVKGSTVEMRCSYTHPSTWKGSVNTVRKTFWFTKWKGGERVDVTTDSEYRGRVEALCGNNICTLSIRNLSESDSAEYKFRITTAGGTFTGSHGVSLNVTDLTVQVGPRFTNRAELKCQSSCDVPSGSSTMIVNILRTALGVSRLIPVCLLGLWARKKKALRSTTEAREPEEMELDCFPVYENRPTPHVESQFQL
ncbi:hypothetical protein KUCAC02_032489 [Chaenocephalus aceratus]|nr:hypothetical protein KUCAC02_032489 [Chaenocephalus aceratus]